MVGVALSYVASNIKLFFPRFVSCDSLGSFSQVNDFKPTFDLTSSFKLCRTIAKLGENSNIANSTDKNTLVVINRFANNFY